MRAFYILAWAAWLALAGCIPKTIRSVTKDATPETWADGSVFLSQPDAAYQILLQVFTPVDEISSSSTFSLFTAREQDGPQGRRFPLFYVDSLNGNPDQLESLTFQPEYHVHADDRSIVDVYARIYKTSPSYENVLRTQPNLSGLQGQYSAPSRIYIGRAEFGRDRIVRVAVNSRLARSLSIVYGDDQFKGNGGIAFHYLDQVNFRDPATKVDCDPKTGCNVLPIELVCRGNITSPECRPPLPAADESKAFLAKGLIDNLTSLGNGAFYITNSQSSAKVAFVSQALASTDAQNNQLCIDNMNIIALSAQTPTTNNACRVEKVTTEKANNGFLACTVEIRFDKPVDISEYGCNVTAIFRGSQKEYQTVQVLLKK